MKTKDIYTDELMMQNYVFKCIKGTKKTPSYFLTMYPFLQWVHSSSNGINRSRAKDRGIAVNSGMTSGVWDILLPFCLTYIELKVGKNKLEKEQISFQSFNEHLFLFKVFNNPHECVDFIIIEALKYDKKNKELFKEKWGGKIPCD